MDLLFENEIALVLIVKNESRYIKEWLEYHYRIGVDKFYIYNNDSDDRSELLKILEPWIDAGVVDFEDASGKYRQMPVYNFAIEQHRFHCRYMGFIDTDEFIYIKTGQTLPEFLHDYFDNRDIISGFCINWRMFGSNGREKYQPIDVIERFTRREKDSPGHSNLVKTIVNPRRILYMPDPHNAQYMIYSEGCDEAFRYIRGANSPYNTCDKIQLNHYYTKSVEEYFEKYSRGRADCAMGRDSNAAINPDFNEVEDLGLRDFWRQIKSQPFPPFKAQTSIQLLQNIKTMIESKFSDHQVERLLTCFFSIAKCDLISKNEKISLRNYTLERLTESISDQVSVVDLTILLTNLPHILITRLPASKNLISKFQNYLPQLIFEYQTELETTAEFHARHMQAMLELI